MRYKKAALLAVIVFVSLAAGCASLRLAFSPNPYPLHAGDTEIVGELRLIGSGIGTVRIDTVTGTVYRTDGSIYAQETYAINRSIPTFVGTIRQEVRVPIDPADLADIDRIVIDVTGSDPGKLVIRIEHK